MRLFSDPPANAVFQMSEHGTDLTVLTPSVSVPVPAIIAKSGKRASRRFVEFFTANIQNPNTREAYARAINTFLYWCEGEADTALHMVELVVVAAYVEKLLKKDKLSKPTVKQHRRDPNVFRLDGYGRYPCG